MKKLDNNLSAAISSLEWAIARNDYSPRKKDEFTSNDFADKANISLRTAQVTLKKMVKNNLLVSRKIPVDGKSTNLYSKCLLQK